MSANEISAGLVIGMLKALEIKYIKRLTLMCAMRG
jgi:hypothetical protein